MGAFTSTKQTGNAVISKTYLHTYLNDTCTDGGEGLKKRCWYRMGVRTSYGQILDKYSTIVQCLSNICQRFVHVQSLSKFCGWTSYVQILDKYSTFVQCLSNICLALNFGLENNSVSNICQIIVHV